MGVKTKILRLWVTWREWVFLVGIFLVFLLFLRFVSSVLNPPVSKTEAEKYINQGKIEIVRKQEVEALKAVYLLQIELDSLETLRDSVIESTALKDYSPAYLQNRLNSIFNN